MTRLNEAARWRAIGAEIERNKSCGPFGLCTYLSRRHAPQHMIFRLYEHVETHTVCGSILVREPFGWNQPEAWADDPSVWETRALLAYFLACEAERP